MLRTNCEPASGQNEEIKSEKCSLALVSDRYNSEDNLLKYFSLISEILHIKKCLREILEVGYWLDNDSEKITGDNLSKREENTLNFALSELFPLYKANSIPTYRREFELFTHISPSGLDQTISQVLPLANELNQKKYSEVIDLINSKNLFGKSVDDLGGFYE